MFYYHLQRSGMLYHWLLVLSAVVPAVFLMLQVYRSDRLEKEEPAFLRSLCVAGVGSALIALVLERIGFAVMEILFDADSQIYQLLLYFVVVGLSEEGAKYYMLKRRSWNSREFNCQYDAVVYAVFVSLGFALWENISYVLHYGFSAAIVRALTAIPGHACFGVFMGVFYGLARSHAFLGEESLSRLHRWLAVLVPMLLHGAYDYIASTKTGEGDWSFLIFIAVLFALSLALVKKLSKNDRYFAVDRRDFPFL
ncbi:MAG: PrsW family intramembrane metalloprotease [Oscillospiraceae bacterium]|nr:PrsW family intramembrane metalloprotease [Oscillospiraceae bacterium]MBR6209475.1 PrsW family intramembrane metalloprotease [Oscillospiraceae bacterium]